jgi:peptidoglycan/LPS O-acetylase OafA/YrhL
LRAIAVLSIILFHAGFTWIPGGYLGVDVFFVISGFLITGILLRENASRTFTLARFYERRARRILPALLAMLFVTAVVAYVLLLPMEFRTFSQSLTAVVLFCSNILFFRRAGAFDFYFDPPARLNPLLHTWSLGVEEQFYLVFPLLLALAWRFGRRRLFQLVLLTAIASFVCALLLDGGYTSIHYARAANFYLLPARAWQLMIGGLVAFWSGAGAERSAGPRPWHQAAALLGLTLILVPILSYQEYKIQFPSVYALAPTLGTAVILAWGSGTLVGALLSLPVLVGVGLISYSAYLWHHPLFALGHTVSLYREFSTATTLAFCTVTLALAWASWRWIENPFRDRNTFTRRTIIGVCTVASAMLLIPAATFAVSDDLPTRGRLLPGGLLQTSRDRVKVMLDCGFDPGAAIPGCALNPALSTAPAFLVVGDSHAAAMLPGFQGLSERTGRQGRMLALAGCIPFFGDVNDNANCEPMQAAALDFAKRSGIRRVFLVSRWAGYTEDLEKRPPFVEALARTIDAYGSSGAVVCIVEQVPQQEYRPVGLYVRSFLHRDRAAYIRSMSVTRAQHEARQSFVTGALAPYRSDPRVTFIDPAAVMCEGDICPAGTGSQSYYWDESHLSVAGARFVSAALEGGVRSWHW